jgi:polyisoprenoid-binding protein YceI
MATVTDVVTPELTGTWDIDPAHSSIEAVARYAMLSSVRGHFGSFSGAITVGPTLEDSHVEVEIDASSIDTGNDRRDGHLRSEDFLHVDAHPKITFRSTRVQPGAGNGSYRVWGDLTMRGVTHEVELDVAFEGVGPDPWGNTRAGVSATTGINRKDWGVNWNAMLETGGVLVGDRLRIELNVSAIRRRDAAEQDGQGGAGASADAEARATS